jgi:hypothetical protein
MTKLRTTVSLRWEMHLSDEGYTCHELRELAPPGEAARRWGWIVNAAAPADGVDQWLAHVGDWGQAALVDRPPPLPDEYENLESFAWIADAKAWVEQQVAIAWKERTA